MTPGVMAEEVLRPEVITLVEPRSQGRMVVLILLRRPSTDLFGEPYLLSKAVKVRHKEVVLCR